MKKLLKKKIYIVSVQEIDPYDEFEVEAYNKKEAKKIAEKIMQEEYVGYEIIDVEEADEI